MKSSEAALVHAAAVKTPPEDAGRNVSASAPNRFQAAEGAREVSVPLAALPPNIAFDDDFPAPIRFDPVRKLLSYRGQMYHSNYVFLRGLSADSAYTHAIDQLFVASDPPESTSGSRTWLLALGIVLAIAALAAGWAILKWVW